ncbi:YHS domain-containing (seleno)protein [Polaribacter ponticola]|uniref:YHS domain-containing (Seleno)protein n=1 Tax=Polaribacter ponticola TaxID=2978475 RepID=A0ABT5SBE2_9FLAO|nr:YHS domain-containing (seleno)protein [Polaribacter sp. MSW5]MDD7915434.1 YHS domain-containing (seleno)protein [Polaribacter sp. MSW5]
MKNLLVILFFTISITFNAQDYNTKKGFVAEGYDVVAYFNNKAVEGSKKFVATYDGVKFKFSTKDNLETFKKSPKKYVPEYGGFCAYAIGVKGKKVSIDPKTFEIRDEKLYLFYNSWGTNTLELWQKGGADKLKKQADINWSKLRSTTLH